MKEFILNYWQIIVAAFLLVLSVIIGVFRKRPITNVLSEVLNRLLLALPALIASAESSGSAGNIKLQAVLELSMSLAEQWLGRKLSEDETSYLTRIIKDNVEAILCTPQKKGINL